MSLGEVSDDLLSKLLSVMEAFPASNDVQVTDKMWYLRNTWAPTLFRYNGTSVWEMWAARDGLKASSALIKLLAILDRPPLDTDIYNPGDPLDILMLYMLYGNEDVRSPYKNTIQILIEIVAKKLGVSPGRKTCWSCN